MVYREKLVAVVVVNGKILREDGDKVYLPFGCEYSLRIKNLESRRALVNISIDSREVVSGGLIVEPNTTVDLERFVKYQDRGNRFKFIKKTEKVVEHRGDRIDDGMIRIEYQFEEMKPLEEPVYRVIHDYYYDYYCPRPWWRPWWRPWYGGVQCGSGITTKGMSSFGVGNAVNSTEGVSAYNSSVSSGGEVEHKADTINQDEGITVEGSVSEQKFQYGAIGKLEENKHVIILRLKGRVSALNEEGQIRRSITVKTRIECTSCGTKSKSDVKFCPECGTALSIV